MSAPKPTILHEKYVTLCTQLPGLHLVPNGSCVDSVGSSCMALHDVFIPIISRHLRLVFFVTVIAISAAHNPAVFHDGLSVHGFVVTAPWNFCQDRKGISNFVIHPLPLWRLRLSSTKTTNDQFCRYKPSASQTTHFATVAWPRESDPGRDLMWVPGILHLSWHWRRSVIIAPKLEHQQQKIKPSEICFKSAECTVKNARWHTSILSSNQIFGTVPMGHHFQTLFPQNVTPSTPRHLYIGVANRYQPFTPLRMLDTVGAHVYGRCRGC